MHFKTKFLSTAYNLQQAMVINQAINKVIFDSERRPLKSARFIYRDWVTKPIFCQDLSAN